MNIEARYFNTEGGAGNENEEPSLEQLKEELNFLIVDIGVNERRIDVLNSYIKAIKDDIKKATLGSKEESEQSIQSWEDVIKRQIDRKKELEEKIAKLENK